MLSLFHSVLVAPKRAGAIRFKEIKRKILHVASKGNQAKSCLFSAQTFLINET